MVHLWNIPDESPVFESEVKVESTEDPMEKAMKALILSDEDCKNVLFTCKYRVKKCKSKTEKDYSITFLYKVPMTISINESLSAYIE